MNNHLRTFTVTAFIILAGCASSAGAPLIPVKPVATHYVTVPNQEQACSGPLSCGSRGGFCTMRCTGDVAPFDCTVLECH